MQPGSCESASTDAPTSGTSAAARGEGGELVIVCREANSGKAIRIGVAASRCKLAVIFLDSAACCAYGPMLAALWRVGHKHSKVGSPNLRFGNAANASSLFFKYGSDSSRNEMEEELAILLLK